MADPIDMVGVSDDELLPRYLFLGAAIAGRRVLEIGALSRVGIAGAKICLELGAREVIALGNAEEVRALDHLDLPPSLNLWEESEALPPRARFDLIAVHRPLALANAAQREEWKSRLSPGGHLMVAVGGAFGRDGPSYAELAAPLNQLFPSVQVVLQRPLTGHALVPFGVEGTPRLDGRLGRDVPPSHYLLICGDHPLSMDGPAVVATAGPSGEPARTERDASLHDAEQLRQQLTKAHAAVREREQWLAELRVELEERDASLASREHDARSAAGDAATARRDAEAYREDRDHARRQLQSRLEDINAALARSKVAEAERDELREKLAATPPEPPTPAPVPLDDGRVAQLEAQLQEAIARGSAAEAERDELREKLAATPPEPVAPVPLDDGRAARLEAELRATLARASAVEAERDDLRQKLSAPPPEPPAPVPLDDGRAARLEAELQATLARASAAELERDELREKLSAPPPEPLAPEPLAPEPPAPPPVSADDGKAAMAEAQLQEALAQLRAAQNELGESERSRRELEGEVTRLIADLREVRSAPAIDAPPVENQPSTVELPAGETRGGSNGSSSDDHERLRIVLRDREERLALLRRELTDKAERISRLLAELHEAKAKGLRLFNR